MTEQEFYELNTLRQTPADRLSALELERKTELEAKESQSGGGFFREEEGVAPSLEAEQLASEEPTTGEAEQPVQEETAGEQPNAGVTTPDATPADIAAPEEKTMTTDNTVA